MPAVKAHNFLVGALMLALVPAVSNAVVITFVATLDGPSESPPVDSPGTGTAAVVYDSAAHTMRVMASFSDLLSPTTAAHIHAPTAVAGTGTASVATQVPSFLGFPLGVTSGAYDQTFDLTLSSSYNPSFITANGGTTASAEAALIDYMLGGRAYFNIHTTAFPGGEIRGFLNAVPESSASTAGLLLLGLASLLVMKRNLRDAAGQ
jgi:hypothetical protein